MPVDKQQHARILIIEDDPTMAHDFQDLLVEAGFEIAGVAGRLEKALALIESGTCDAAVVDANLAGVSASPAASALAARGLPYIVLSGYSREQIQGAYPGALFIQKPCRPAQLIQALNTILLKQ
jgi:DNA-binding response OmpR family regulator